MSKLQLYMVELAVADWPAALAWYRDVLGLAAELVDEPHQFALLAAGGARVALKAGTPQPGGVALVFQTNDLDAELARLTDRGVTADGPIKSSVEGYRRAFVRDRDGYRIGLFEWTGAAKRHE